MNNIDTDPKKIDEILTRSVREILPSRESLREKMLSGERLKIYIGTDATGTSLHIGHATNYMILEKFRQLGHEIIFLIGDFTSRIGDPDKKTVRKQLTREDVVQNVKTWLKQVRPVIRLDDPKNPVRVVYNHDWLSRLTFEDIIGIASHFTVQRLLERDMFEKRMKEKQPIYLHEFFYPLMQGYDSVVLDVDVEMCGNDQKFNALAGRTLMRKMKDKEKFVFITTLLENPKTGEKMMSKSLGTGVYLDWSADQMFGGIMAQPDENIYQLFVDCTHISLSEIVAMDAAMKDGSLNPRDAKMRLAREIVAIYHGEEAAVVAEQNFINTFSRQKVPDDVSEYILSQPTSIVDFLVMSKCVKSKTEARSLIKQNAVTRMDTDEDISKDVVIDKTFDRVVLKVGKRRFVKVVYNGEISTHRI